MAYNLHSLMEDLQKKNAMYEFIQNLLDNGLKVIEIFADLSKAIGTMHQKRVLKNCRSWAYTLQKVTIESKDEQIKICRPVVNYRAEFLTAQFLAPLSISMILPLSAHILRFILHAGDTQSLQKKVENLGKEADNTGESKCLV